MEQAAHGGTASLSEFGDALRRRWWMLALGSVIGLALSSAYLLAAPKTYESSALVQVYSVGPSDEVVDGARTNSGINLDTEAQLVKSQAVSARAKEILETPVIVGQLVQNVSVSVPPNTSVLKVTYTAPSPQEAQRGASAFADAYLRYRNYAASKTNDEQERSLRQEIARLQKESESLTGLALEAKNQEIITLNSRLNSLVGSTFNGGEIISQALVPRRPASPNALLVLFSGFALGILIGLLGVAYLERRDGRIYDWRFLERRLGIPVLVEVPGERNATPELLAAHSPGGQAFTQLRNVLMSGMPTGGVILVAEPEDGSGSDVVAANLGAAFARADQRTTVVVADVTSSVPAILGAPQGPGLAELLRKRTSLIDVRREVSKVTGLTVIAPGFHLDTEIDDLEGAGIADVIASVAERSRVVIVRAPATTAGADAQLLARLSDAAIAVVAVGGTHRVAIDETLRQWSIIGTQVPGVVAVTQYGPGPDPILVAPKKNERTGERLSRAAASR